MGPLVGAAIVVLVENVLSNSVERWPTVLGVIFVLAILFARSGLVGSATKLAKRLRDRRSAGRSPVDAVDSTDAIVSGSNPSA
jgi:branched-chain amino acid transport system permease protein